MLQSLYFYAFIYFLNKKAVPIFLKKDPRECDSFHLKLTTFGKNEHYLFKLLKLLVQTIAKLDWNELYYNLVKIIFFEKK